MYAPGSLHILSLPALRAHLAQQCPFYYNWVVFVVAASTSYAARPLMSVAVLSVFMVPMTDAFGWSRGLLAGAVSLGGVCAVVISPLVSRLIDRYGSGWMISTTSAVAGACTVGLSAVSQTWAFYTLYSPGRMDARLWRGSRVDATLLKAVFYARVVACDKLLLRLVHT